MSGDPQTVHAEDHQSDRDVTAKPLSSGRPALVAIGASAGGLEACQQLLDALPVDTGLAFILVQHLDPDHPSLMVELLAHHTTMPVSEAADATLIEPNHVYVIPPGVYLSVSNKALHLSPPEARHGARLPIDFLLNSLAEAYGPLAVCVILSGTGGDGSVGLAAIKQHGGFVIVQRPDEAAFGGMPDSAIATGFVDRILAIREMPAALAEHMKAVASPPPAQKRGPDAAEPPELGVIIDLLRQRTGHDFTLYKRGTLQRRIERRMGMAAVDRADMARYRAMLQQDDHEATALAKDLLIHVTSFFRDPPVFEMLATSIIPDLIRNQTGDQPLRVWVAGCSTGEETYSIAMLFLEALAGQTRPIVLQIFASDVDADAVARARDGHYAADIEAHVSVERLARFFRPSDNGYTVLPELRETVVFTVQDVLSDPPFSRLDLISCRNLLIYLKPEAQAKVIALFHFGLRPGGVLLLGGAETVSQPDDRFELIAKTERLYRHVGRSRPGGPGLSAVASDASRLTMRRAPGAPPSRQAGLAELARRLVVEAFAPAAVLINQRHECLYLTGPTDRYLGLAPGLPSQDLLVLAREDIRVPLRSALRRVSESQPHIVVPDCLVTRDGTAAIFTLDVRAVTHEGETFLLVAFLDAVAKTQRESRNALPEELPRLAQLERDLDEARSELKGAIRELELSGEAQKAINDEALSVNEEYQSTNEELLTSKEELQSLNEELIALNSQLQETLERQRTTANDLQNVLYSTDVATLFLDLALNIRFFTPATESLFHVLSSDLGRPLADLTSLASDSALSRDARAVLRDLAPVEREIEAQNGIWYLRRVLPYRTHDGGIEGVVITFTDTTERKRTATALEAARQRADHASLAKSRFLAAASHDLRQPLQTFALIQSMLAKVVEGDKAKGLVARLDQSLAAMSGMLNTLLDINQIEAGTVHAEPISFPVQGLLDRFRNEFTDIALTKGLHLKVMPCRLMIQSDPVLLEQILRNLLSNALKYTLKGRILLGCRRRRGMIAIEIWDTGIGMPEGELQAIFDEYHQIDNPARERSRGIGLGLAIVRRLGHLLGHRVTVRSHIGKGSVFAIEAIAIADIAGRDPATPVKAAQPPRSSLCADILVIEDDPDMRELLGLLLTDDGHKVTLAADGIAAIRSVLGHQSRPDLILADYNLPNGMNGIEAIRQIRRHLQVPAIILTGDISSETARAIVQNDCVPFNKPIRPSQLTTIVQTMLSAPKARSGTGATRPAVATTDAAPVIFIVDDDGQLCEALRLMLEDDGRTVQSFTSAEAFLASYRPGSGACLLIDALLPGMDGLDLLQRLHRDADPMPAIMMTGHGDVSMAVAAMKAGAKDFIQKPVGRAELLASLDRALVDSEGPGQARAEKDKAKGRIAGLTERQREVMAKVLAGHPSKNIAADLGISQRTVENHRAEIMRKTGAKSLPALARLAVLAAA